MLPAKKLGKKSFEEIKHDAMTKLKLLDMEDQATKLTYRLSGGQKQRVAIARALINNPIIIMGDEPTGNLDPQMSLEITELLYQISQSGTAVLMASHDYIAMQKFSGDVWICQGNTLTRAENK